jgi:predicted ABC-type transport system involved in lysophospholipase L1 biosynthesis ATPase subunit
VNRDGTALVIVTHDAVLAARASRTVLLRDGSVEREHTR